MRGRKPRRGQQAPGEPTRPPGRSLAARWQRVSARTAAERTAAERPVAQAGPAAPAAPGSELAVRDARSMVVLPSGQPGIVPSGGATALSDIHLLRPLKSGGALARWEHHPTGPVRKHSVVALAMLTLVILMCLVVVGWRMMGGRMVVMETPSMCPRICVGSLVADMPMTGPPHLHQIVTFYPPGSLTSTYTHQIVHIYPNGMLETKGFANPHHDPWLLAPSGITGRVIFTVPGLGWLLKALPLLAVGVLAWVIVRPHIAPRVRRGWDRVWMTGLMVLPLMTLHPLLNGQVISSNGKRDLRATVVNSGLLPEDIHGAGRVLAHHVRAGHIAHIAVNVAHGQPMFSESASLPWWGWLLVFAGVSWPLIGFIWHFCRDDEVPPKGAPPHPHERHPPRPSGRQRGSQPSIGGWQGAGLPDLRG